MKLEEAVRAVVNDGACPIKTRSGIDPKDRSHFDFCCKYQSKVKPLPIKVWMVDARHRLRKESTIFVVDAPNPRDAKHAVCDWNRAQTWELSRLEPKLGFEGQVPLPTCASNLGSGTMRTRRFRIVGELNGVVYGYTHETTKDYLSAKYGASAMEGSSLRYDAAITGGYDAPHASITISKRKRSTDEPDFWGKRWKRCAPQPKPVIEFDVMAADESDDEWVEASIDD